MHRFAKTLVPILLSLPGVVLAQGSLTPPAGPAASMKTLAQVEPRTPLVTDNSGVEIGATRGITITAPGSYYLTGNLTVTADDGITINASNVTVDLQGYTIASSAQARAGAGIIVMGDRNQIAIRNGFVSGSTTYSGTMFVPGPGFEKGIVATEASHVTVSEIGVDGVWSNAIETPYGTVRACLVRTCGGAGIQALFVSHSVASPCGGTAIFAATAESCSATSTGGIGLQATFATNCYGNATGMTGLYASTASNCHGISKTGTGLLAVQANDSDGLSTSGLGLMADVATHCTGSSTSGTGLRAIKTAIGCLGRTASGSYGLQAGSTATTAGSASDSRGEATSTSATGSIGLYACTADNCTGTSAAGIGLTARVATNCYGTTVSGTCGIEIAGTANGCRGSNATGAAAVALRAGIAVACTAETGIIDSPSKQLGTP